MTSLATRRRLLDGTGTDHAAHLALHGELPRITLRAVLDEVERSGLTGRGGGGFSTAAKIRAVAAGRRRPVLVGNAMEGEPLSRKDAALLARSPHLVLDGLVVLGQALGARRLVLATGPGVDPLTLAPAGSSRGVEVRALQGGFVAGQESALVNRLEGRRGVPRDPFVRVTESGVDRRPTLVLNAETLAHLALLLRYGADWFRSAGTVDDPGTSLFTVSGSVRRPGVVEGERGARLGDVLAPAEPVRPAAVLVGGYHGTWVRASELDVRLTGTAAASARTVAPGAGVLHLLDDSTCPLAYAAEVTAYLAQESTRQCGPCLNGLPRLSHDLQRLAAGVRDPGLPARLAEVSELVTGRGACSHPDGSARFVASTLDVFRDHVAAHLEGWCTSGRRAAS